MKSIARVVHLPSVVQSELYEATRILFICKVFYVYLRFDLNENSASLHWGMIQKSIRCLRSMGNIQNGATVTRRNKEEMNCWKKVYFYFLCIQKVFWSLHKIQIEPLMADGLRWQCFSYFSGPRQCYLLGSQWDSHKPPWFLSKIS